MVFQVVAYRNTEDILLRLNASPTLVVFGPPICMAAYKLGAQKPPFSGDFTLMKIVEYYLK